MYKNFKSESFIKRVCEDALKSSAINHPYLRAISEGCLPDMDLAIKDFAYQYGLYNKHFIYYLSTVINGLSDENHKQVLQSNLYEERGHVHDVNLPKDVLDSIDKVSHTQLYRRFQTAVGADLGNASTDSDYEAGIKWSKEFLSLCEMNECVGVGAIGIGTELIVSDIYRQILEGLKNYTQLTLTQRVFFELHCECDDDHAGQLIDVALDLAINEEACKQIEYGATMAINMRTEFWNEMLKRALSLAGKKTHETQEAI